MQEFLGGGAEKKVGTNNTYDIRAWGTFSAKSAPSGALSPRSLPQLGHFLCGICPTLGTFTAKSVKCAPPGAVSLQNVPHLGHFLRKMCPTWGTLRKSVGHPWQEGGAMAPFAPTLYPPLLNVCFLLKQNIGDCIVHLGGREQI